MKRLVKWMMAPVLAAAIAFVPAAGGASVAQAAAQSSTQQSAISVVLDGKKLALAQAPYMKGGTTLVPMKAIFTGLGASVSWTQSTKTVFARKGYVTVSMQAGANTAVMNGKSVKLAAPVEIKNGTTFVPLRFVGETFGAEVKWNPASRTITITSAEALQAAIEQQEEEERANSILTTSENVSLNDEKVVMITTDVSQGSGVIVGENEIITNYHVMDGASEAQAITVDGETYKVEGVIASDEEADLALIQTKEGLGIEPVSFAPLFDLEKGEPVVAIGSPLGVQNTATEGIVSNIEFMGDVEYIQFSAPIDHGSSGGGLFNQYGELIGITSAGYDDVNMDINYAVSGYHVLKLAVDYWTSDEQKKPAFLPSKLPASLKDYSMDQLATFMGKHFSSIQVTGAIDPAQLTDWKAARDDKGWLVFEANIDPIFYTLYGEKTKDQLGLWALNTGYELRTRLPDEIIRIKLNFEREVDFEPRGYADGEVTALGDGKWKIAYNVLDYQGKTSAVLKLR